MPSTFEQLRTTSAGSKLRILIDHLIASVHNPVLINSLLYVMCKVNSYSVLRPSPQKPNAPHARWMKAALTMVDF